MWIKTATKIAIIIGIYGMILLLQACGSVGTGRQNAQQAPLETARTYVFTCDDDYTFVAQTEEDIAWLFLPTGTLALQKGSDGTYRSGNVTFQLKQQVGLLESPEEEHLNCRNNRSRAVWEHAKLSGADFRATGNEPGWSMEIHNQDKIILVTGYGTGQYEYDLPKPEIDSDTRLTRYEVNEEMILIISGEPCSDSMSGEIFESQVKIIHKEKTLYGCGRALH